MDKYWKHFKTITKHKWYVFKLMCKCGHPIQGLMHDMSKFSPIEFVSSARYWNGKRSPIDNEKDDKSYSSAWQHHKGHNPHHPEYWLDNVMTIGEEPTPLIMPYKYACELICDWIGAGIAYGNGKINYSEPLEYYLRVNQHRRIHSVIKDFVLEVLSTINEDQSFAVVNKVDLAIGYEMALWKWELDNKGVK